MGRRDGLDNRDELGAAVVHVRFEGQRDAQVGRERKK